VLCREAFTQPRAPASTVRRATAATADAARRGRRAGARSCQPRASPADTGPRGGPQRQGGTSLLRCPVGEARLEAVGHLRVLAVHVRLQLRVRLAAAGATGGRAGGARGVSRPARRGAARGAARRERRSAPPVDVESARGGASQSRVKGAERCRSPRRRGPVPRRSPRAAAGARGAATTPRRATRGTHAMKDDLQIVQMMLSAPAPLRSAMPLEPPPPVSLVSCGGGRRGARRGEGNGEGTRRVSVARHTSSRSSV